MQNKAKGQKRGKMIKRGVDDDLEVLCVVTTMDKEVD